MLTAFFVHVNGVANIYIYIDILYAYYGKDMTNAINLWLATVLSILGQRLATCHTLLHDVRRLDARVVGGVHSNWARNATRFTQYRYCLHLPVLCIEIRSDSSFLCILYIPCIFLTDCEGFGGQNFQTCGLAGGHVAHMARPFRYLHHATPRRHSAPFFDPPDPQRMSCTDLHSWQECDLLAINMNNRYQDCNEENAEPMVGLKRVGIQRNKKERPNHPTLAVRIEIVEE